MIAPNLVGQLAEMLNAPDNPWKPLLMIDARSYFDDSGTHPRSVVTIIGGFAATKAVWEQVEAPWRATLDEFAEKGIDCFHATDCLNQAGQFERLKSWECEYVYRQLSDILEKAEAQPIYAAVRSKDWEAITCQNFKALFLSAYDFCVDRVISELVNWSSRNAGGSAVPIVIARQQEHESETERTAQSWFKVDVIKNHVGPLSFAFPKQLIPLQAADMLAHEVYRHATWMHAMENKIRPPSERLHPPVLNKIMSGRRLGANCGLFDREFLEQYAGGIRVKSG